MTVRIQYMGTKQDIAADVAEVVSSLRPDRPLLDLFCGMCSVAGAVSPSDRPVWGNDVQEYAAHAARCMITSTGDPPNAQQTVALLLQSASRNEAALMERFARALEIERDVLDSPSVEAYRTAYGAWRHAANDATIAEEVALLAQHRRAAPYRLATLTFAWGYFGLTQAIAIDSLRYAIERERHAGNLDRDEKEWALLALLQAASRLATGPGHTAQYLAASTSTSLERVVRQRRRNIYRQFEIELGLLRPFGSREWRSRNRVFSCDALAIWSQLTAQRFRDAVIYADPPYSKNQYSRFYHVLETLQRYDYPSAHGRGRYRPDRFSTGFSSRARVASSFDRLCEGASALNCALVLSYPDNGLLLRYEKGNLKEILSRHFSRVDLALEVPARHSTLGARHGQRNNPVNEMVFVAEP